MTPFAELLKKNFWLILWAVFLVMTVVVIVTPRLSQTAEVSISVTVPTPQRAVSGDYEYDGYYALQAADLFSSTLTGWLKSPEFAALAYEKAGMELPAKTIRRISGVFGAKKVSSQIVTVEYRARGKTEAEKLAFATANLLKEKVEIFNREGNDSLNFNVIIGEPLILETRRNTLSMAGIAGLVSLVLAINFIILKDAWKNPSNGERLDVARGEP